VIVTFPVPVTESTLREALRVRSARGQLRMNDIETRGETKLKRVALNSSSSC